MLPRTNRERAAKFCIERRGDFPDGWWDLKIASRGRLAGWTCAQEFKDELNAAATEKGDKEGAVKDDAPKPPAAPSPPAAKQDPPKAEVRFQHILIALGLRMDEAGSCRAARLVRALRSCRSFYFIDDA